MTILSTARSLFSALCLAAICAAATAVSADAKPAAKAAAKPAASAGWPQFLGPHRNGISNETGLLTAWPEGGPKEVWRVPGGVGMSGLAIVDNRCVTLVQRGGQQVVVALDARTGEQLWESALAPAYSNSMGNGPRATPAIAHGLVFAFTGEGILAAVQLSDGKLVWKRALVKDLDGDVADYGMACSPLVVGDTVVITAGVPGATVVACNAKSGEIVWKTGEDTAGYSSPALLNVGGRQQIVAFTGKSALGLSPEQGQLLWRFPYKTEYDCNIATPVAWDNHVLLSSGENHGSVLLSLKPRDDGLEPQEVWSSFGAKSSLRSEWQTPVLLNGYLYGFDNVGSAGPVTHLNCVEIATGKRVWQQVRFGKGNLIAADGKLFITTMKGELVVVRATPDKFIELGRQELIGQTRQAPALANGLLYLRDDKEILCLDARGRVTP